MPVVKQGNHKDTTPNIGAKLAVSELAVTLQWSADRAKAESRRARQEIFERLCACPAHPATLQALESIKARLFSGTR